jgi:hypothetical protein
MEKNKGNQRLGPWAIFPDQPTSPTPAAHINHACSSLCDCLTGSALPVTAARAWVCHFANMWGRKSVPHRLLRAQRITAMWGQPRRSSIYLPSTNSRASLAIATARGSTGIRPKFSLVVGIIPPRGPCHWCIKSKLRPLLAISLGPRCPSPHRRGN